MAPIIIEQDDGGYGHRRRHHHDDYSRHHYHHRSRWRSCFPCFAYRRPYIHSTQRFRGASVAAFLFLLAAFVLYLLAALSLPYAASGTVLTGLFPAKTRYTGVGLAQNIAGMLSGFIPVLATGFVASAGDHWWPAAAMLIFLSLFTAVAGAIAPRLSVSLPGFKH